MKKLFTNREFDLAKSRDELPLECHVCCKTFYRTKNQIQKVIKGQTNIKFKYCNNDCFYEAKITKKEVVCLNCNSKFYKQLKNIKRSPNHFCSQSCAATYNNKHKKYGIRRSKFEVFTEKELRALYNMNIKFNSRTIIGSELDIYIPSLSLAFEINGIHHYKPIYGQDTLKRIQKNDRRKKVVCKKKNIKLITINISKISHFTEKNAQKFFNKITKVIDGVDDQI